MHPATSSLPDPSIAGPLSGSAARRLATLAGIAALLLAGCGGGDGTDPTAVAASPAAAGNPSATPAPTPAAPSPSPSSSPAPAPTPASSPAPAPSPAPSPAPAASPSPAPASSTTADITCGLANFRAEMLQRINQHRAAGASCGSRGSFPPAAALTWNDRLTASAYGHSADMAQRNYFSHTSLDGRSFSTRITEAGYVWQSAGENIAAGQGSVQQVMDGWMASDGHCANIMNASYVDVGVACARSTTGYRIYWTQNFGRPR